MRLPVNLEKARLKAMSRETLDDFYSLLEDAIKQCGDIDQETLSHIIFNCDETGISTHPKRVKVVAMRGEKRIYNICETTKYDYTTLNVCGNAAGEMISPQVIYRNVALTDKLTSWPGARYYSSPSGWINSDLFLHWFEQQFIPEANQYRPDGYTGPIILIMDGHSTHTNLNICRSAHENNIILLKLPSHATHLVQPLDRSFFGELKAILSMILDRMREPGKQDGGITKDRFPEILEKLWDRVKAKWLKAGFEKAGFIPFNKRRITDEEINIAVRYPWDKNGVRHFDPTHDPRLALERIEPDEDTPLVTDYVRRQLIQSFAPPPISTTISREISKSNI